MERYKRKADDDPFIDDDKKAFVMIADMHTPEGRESRAGSTLLREFYGTEFFKGLTAEKIIQVKQEYLAV